MFVVGGFEGLVPSPGISTSLLGRSLDNRRMNAIPAARRHEMYAAAANVA